MCNSEIESIVVNASVTDVYGHRCRFEELPLTPAAAVQAQETWSRVTRFALMAQHT